MWYDMGMREMELSQLSGVADNPHVIELGVVRSGTLACGLTMEQFFSEYEFDRERYLSDEDLAHIPEITTFPSDAKFLGELVTAEEPGEELPIMYFFLVDGVVVRFNPQRS